MGWIVSGVCCLSGSVNEQNVATSLWKNRLFLIVFQLVCWFGSEILFQF